MTESDRMKQRIQIETLLKDTSIEDSKRINDLISEMKTSLVPYEVSFDMIALLVFLYKNDLILKQKEKNEKE